MQCPVCNHDATVAEFGDPLRCPDCGAYYEKAAWERAGLLTKAQHDRERPAIKIASRKSGSADALHVQNVMREFPGAQPVVVLDVNMGFNSMVLFMIKWALAAIPAMLILFLIGFFLVMLLGSLG